MTPPLCRLMASRPAVRCYEPVARSGRIVPGLDLGSKALAVVVAQPSSRAPPSALRAKCSKRGPGTTQATGTVPERSYQSGPGCHRAVTGGEDELVQYLGYRHHHDILPEVTISYELGPAGPHEWEYPARHGSTSAPSSSTGRQ